MDTVTLEDVEAVLDPLTTEDDEARLGVESAADDGSVNGSGWGARTGWIADVGAAAGRPRAGVGPMLG